MARTPITVELPVCGVCGRVGKQPLTMARRDHCTGGIQNPHKQVRMTPKKFVEVLAPAEAA